MFLGHTSGDNAFLKQGVDAVPIPVEDGIIVSMGFSEGEISYLELIEAVGADATLAECLYEEVVENTIIPDDTIGSDATLTECLYEEVISGNIVPTEFVGVDATLAECFYVDAIIDTSLAEALGYAMSIGSGNHHDAVEATPLLSEAVGYGISIGNGSHV